VLARLNKLQQLGDINLGLAVASILYFAISMVLLLVSAWPEPHLVDSGVFHTLDFGSNFFFALIEVLTLAYSPERRFSAPKLLRILMFLSVCSTSVALLLIILNRATFEVVAHNIDYLNDFTVALVDSLLVSTVVRSPASHPGQRVNPESGLRACARPVAVIATLVPVTLSFAQVLIYNVLGVDLRGHLLGERPAHVVEFIFNGVGAAINFWFCLDSRNLTEELTRQIMLAPDELIVVIDPTSNTSVHTADECGRSPYIRPTAPPIAPGWSFGSNGHSLLSDTISESHGHDHQCSAHAHAHASHAHAALAAHAVAHDHDCEHDHDCAHDHAPPPTAHAHDHGVHDHGVHDHGVHDHGVDMWGTRGAPLLTELLLPRPN